MRAARGPGSTGLLSGRITRRRRLGAGLEGGIDHLHDEALLGLRQALDALDLLQELGRRPAPAGAATRRRSAPRRRRPGWLRVREHRGGHAAACRPRRR